MNHTDAEAAPPRHAVYFAPEVDHPLWAAGVAWLGRDPRQWPTPAEPAPRPHTASPAHYGFHATLKPPMVLAEDAQPPDFRAAVQALAARHRAFEMPRLQVAWLGRFLAVQSAETLAAGHPLRRLADACVQELDAFRRAPGADELRRRRAVGLDAEQDALLQRWGYPHVLQRWRFHMTLSDSWPDREAADARSMAAEAVAHFRSALATPVVCRSVCVYTQTAPGQAFRLTERFALST